MTTNSPAPAAGAVASATEIVVLESVTLMYLAQGFEATVAVSTICALLLRT